MPLAEPGGGTGHLRRCVAVASHLGDRAVVLAPDAGVARVWRDTGMCPPELVLATEAAGCWDLVVLDRRTTSREELGALARGAPVMALDDAGEARRYAAYVLDAIPGTPTRAGPANLRAPYLMELPAPARRSPPAAIRKVLVSLGGEDPARLTERLVQALERSGLDRTLEVTVVQGPGFGRRIRAAGMRVLERPPTLAGYIEESDIVVTMYGLTAFEALAAGTPVLLCNPTPYHARLSRIGRLPVIRRRGLSRELCRHLARPARLWAPVAAFQTMVAGGPQARGYAGLAALVARIADALPEPRALAGLCPVCGERHPVTHRFEDRTYARCPGTLLRYAVPFPVRKRVYGADYFREEYRAQYGRTYLEDFDAIKEVSRARVGILARWLEAPGPVLDIGCAYGPFLAAAAEAGYRAAGLDIAQEAVDHVRGTLGMEAWCADFATCDLAPLRSLAPRALTLWYVIEHFLDLASVLARANTLLPLGGVLAFSTPSSAGVSARMDLGRFLERSPMDHYTIWSPRCAHRVLRRFGFRVVGMRITGHHPERSGALGGLGPLGMAVSRLLGLGDTFEVYARKTADAGATHA